MDSLHVHDQPLGADKKSVGFDMAFDGVHSHRDRKHSPDVNGELLNALHVCMDALSKATGSRSTEFNSFSGDLQQHTAHYAKSTHGHKDIHLNAPRTLTKSVSVEQLAELTGTDEHHHHLRDSYKKKTFAQNITAMSHDISAEPPSTARVREELDEFTANLYLNNSSNANSSQKHEQQSVVSMELDQSKPRTSPNLPPLDFAGLSIPEVPKDVEHSVASNELSVLNDKLKDMKDKRASFTGYSDLLDQNLDLLTEETSAQAIRPSVVEKRTQAKTRIAQIVAEGRRQARMIAMLKALKPDNDDIGDEVEGDFILDKTESRYIVDGQEFQPSRISYNAPYTFFPDDPWRIYWDMIIIFIIMAYGVIVPLSAAFDIRNSIISTFDIIFTILLLMDLVLNFFTAYNSSKGWYEAGILEIRIKRIVRHYLKFWFWFDSLASLPLSLWFTVGDKYSMIFLFKLFIVVRFPRIEKRVRYTSRTNPAVWRLLKLLWLMILIWHWTACSYWFVSTIIGFGEDSWVPPIDFVDTSLSEQYIFALYWAVIVTTGVGDPIPPEIFVERIFHMCAIIVGLLIYAFVIGSVAAAVSDIDALDAEWRLKQETINRFLVTRKVPVNLVKSINEYYECIRISKMSNANDLTDLHPALRQDLFHFLTQPILDRVPLFRQQSKACIVAIITKLHSRIYLPDELVITKGAEGEELYFIIRGKYKEKYSDSELWRTRRTGQFFGHEALIFNKYQSCVKCVTHGELFCLDFDDLKQICHRFPTMAESLAHSRNAADKQRKRESQDPSSTMDNKGGLSRWLHGWRRSTSITIPPSNEVAEVTEVTKVKHNVHIRHRRASNPEEAQTLLSNPDTSSNPSESPVKKRQEDTSRTEMKTNVRRISCTATNPLADVRVNDTSPKVNRDSSCFLPGQHLRGSQANSSRARTRERRQSQIRGAPVLGTSSFHATPHTPASPQSILKPQPGVKLKVARKARKVTRRSDADFDKLKNNVHRAKKNFSHFSGGTTKSSWT